MTELDFVLLTVYFLCVTYVLYQIVNSFNDEFTIWLDKNDLNEQLTAQNLQDSVEIAFKFNNRYEFNALKSLVIMITNKSNDRAIYVDWDYCALTDQYDLPRRSRRVTRRVPGGTLDALQRQVFSVVAPGKTLREEIVGEDMLTRTGDSGIVDSTKPVLDFTKPDKKASAKKKQQYKDFMSGKEKFQFELQLVLRIVGYGTSQTGDRLGVTCRFYVRKLDWTAGLPWNPRFP